MSSKMIWFTFTLALPILCCICDVLFLYKEKCSNHMVLTVCLSAQESVNGIPIHENRTGIQTETTLNNKTKPIRKTPVCIYCHPWWYFHIEMHTKRTQNTYTHTRLLTRKRKYTRSKWKWKFWFNIESLRIFVDNVFITV